MFSMRPESWSAPTTLNVNGSHAVTSALEIASNTSFPKTAAAVRAVPFEQKFYDNPGQDAVSGPGQTFWKGARGVRELDLDLSAPPPDIVLECIDESTVPETKRTIRITWDQSWQDVLDELHYTFGKPCTFVSETGKHVSSEDEFDEYCNWLEEREESNLLKFSKSKELKGKVYIKEPVFYPSAFVTDKFVPVPIEKEEIDEYTGLPLIPREQPSDARANNMDAEASLPQRVHSRRPFWRRWDDTPFPLEYTIVFGGVGFYGSCAAIVGGYWVNWNSLAAITVAITCHLFLMSLFVSAVEDGSASLGRLGLGMAGFFCSLICIGCLSVSQEYIALIAAFLWLLASFWFIEVSVRARGWGSWYTGAFQLCVWLMGGCPIQGFIRPEPVEQVIILGRPPKPSLVARGQTLVRSSD